MVKFLGTILTLLIFISSAAFPQDVGATASVSLLSYGFGYETTNTDPRSTATATPLPTTASNSLYKLDPASVTITLGQTAQFALKQGNTAGGSLSSVASPIWSLPNGGGTITTRGDSNEYGLFKPDTAGTFIVKAQRSNGSAVATVLVKPKNAASSTPVSSPDLAPKTATDIPSVPQAYPLTPASALPQPAETPAPSLTVVPAEETKDLNVEEGLNPLVLNCVQRSVGQERFIQIQQGNSKLTQEELQQGRQCFEAQTNALKLPLTIQASSSQQQCLQTAIGQDRYEQIILRHLEPTAKEKQKTRSCLEATQTSTQSFLPVPAEAVPFVPVSKQEAAIQKVESSKGTERKVVIFTGKAAPNALVDIYIFSQPIVVTTKADANGNWNYELSYHLPQGDHKAYTVIRQSEKGLLRSEVFSFGVAYAAGLENAEPEILIIQPSDTGQMRRFVVIGSCFILAGIGVLLIIFRSKISKVCSKGDHAEPQPLSDTPQMVNQVLPSEPEPIIFNPSQDNLKKTETSH